MPAPRTGTLGVPAPRPGTLGVPAPRRSSAGTRRADPRAGDFFDDGLTVLERKQIEAGKEAYLTGGAKLRYKKLTGQI